MNYQQSWNDNLARKILEANVIIICRIEHRFNKIRALGYFVSLIKLRNERFVISRISEEGWQWREKMT